MQVKGPEAEDLIEEYLVSQYRPFAINDIIQNLHNKVSKTVAQKALENLTVQERILTKTFGKVVIYACKEQELFSAEKVDVDNCTLQTLTELRCKLVELDKDKNIALETWTRTIKEPPNCELIEVIEKNEDILQGLEEELEELETNWDPKNDAAIQQIIQTRETLLKETKQRSKWFKCLVSLVKDTIRPKNMAEFLVS